MTPEAKTSSMAELPRLGKLIELLFTTYRFFHLENLTMAAFTCQDS